MDSNVGLAIQCVGVLLITLLSMFMRSSIKSIALKYWTASWASLSIALMSLFIGFQIAPRQNVFYSGYFFGEYLFGPHERTHRPRNRANRFVARGMAHRVVDGF